MKLYNLSASTQEELLRSGEIAKSQYDWPKALLIWNEYRRRYPCDPIGHAKSIKTLIESRKLEEAEKLLIETLPRFPDAPDIAMCVGEIPMRRYQWSNAVQEWIEFRKKFPNHPTGFICGIISLRQKGKVEEASKLLSEALKISPNEPRVFAQMGEFAMDRKDWHNALPIWEEIRSRFPNHPIGYTRGINALIQANEDEAAESLLKKALNLFPHDIGIAGQNGELAMWRQEWEKAIQIWEDLRNRFPNHPTGYTRGLSALIQAGEEDAAESLLKNALGLFPHDIEFAVKNGELAMRRGDWRKAIHIWEVIRQKFPDDFVGYTSGIISLLQASEYEKAERVLKAGNLKKMDLKASYDRINNMYLEAQDWISALRLMINCDSDILFSSGWRRKFNQALDALKYCRHTSKGSYASLTAQSQAMKLIIQIRRWIDWSKEQTLIRLQAFLETCQNRIFFKPSSILTEIICDKNFVQLRGGTLKFTNEDDLFIQLQELLNYESYWFASPEDNPFIIDCGTHFGLSLYYYKSLYPNAKILAFEPNPQLFALAKRNVSQNNWTNIDLMPYAIGSKTETRKFHIPKNCTAMAGSLLKRLSAFGFELDSIDVQTLRLSEIIDTQVNFLKMDVEGAEYEVIDDIKNKLNCIQNLFCEFHLGGGVKSRDLVKAMELLDRSGFELRINLSSHYNRLLKNKPISDLGQISSNELWGTRLK